MSHNLWRPHLESYLAVREAMGHSVRAERKLLGEFLDFVDQKSVPDRSVPNGLLIGLVCSRREEEWVARPDA
jgi:hypothetical protein